MTAIIEETIDTTIIETTETDKITKTNNQTAKKI